MQSQMLESNTDRPPALALAAASISSSERIAPPGMGGIGGMGMDGGGSTDGGSGMWGCGHLHTQHALH